MTFFEPVTPQRGFEEVARQIQQAILEGKLQAGDKLPSQRELIEIFHVSKASVLEALRVLEKAGLITVKHGATGGAFVREVSTDQLTESLQMLLKLKRVSYRELAEFRKRLEGGTAQWAAMRAGDADLAEMEAILCRMNALLEAMPEAAAAVTDADAQFHIAVAKASGNGPSVAVMHAIHNSMIDAFYHIPTTHFPKMYCDLCGIYEAIKIREPQMAEDRMTEHIAFFNRIVLANTEGNGVIDHK